MRKGILLLISLISLFLMTGCSGVEKGALKLATTEVSTELTAPETQTKVWDMAVIDEFYTADLETLLGFYHESIDGAYAEAFASRLSVLYSELGVREILKGLGQVEEKDVKGIAKLLISERLIEFGEPGREELEKDFGALLPISAMSAEEAKALQLMMEALDETSEWMK